MSLNKSKKSIQKYCLFCKNVFFDITKNSNRFHCGSQECKQQQKTIYLERRDKEKCKEISLKFHAKNPNYLAIWRSKNKERDRELNRINTLKRYHNNPNAKIAHSLRHRLYQATKGTAKLGSHVAYLGCTIDEFKLYIESKFLPGMSWDNYAIDGWHIDHIMPLSKFNLQELEQLKIACHYTNLQPLWAKDNLAKGNKDVYL